MSVVSLVVERSFSPPRTQRSRAATQEKAEDDHVHVREHGEDRGGTLSRNLKAVHDHVHDHVNDHVHAHEKKPRNFVCWPVK